MSARKRPEGWGGVREGAGRGAVPGWKAGQVQRHRGRAQPAPSSSLLFDPRQGPDSAQGAHAMGWTLCTRCWPVRSCG
jgi:hypothetical protein